MNGRWDGYKLLFSNHGASGSILSLSQADNDSMEELTEAADNRSISASCSDTKQHRVATVPSTLTQVVESQPIHTTTTIGKCGGEPDPLDDKLPETEASQQTSKGRFTIHSEICPADHVPSDHEERSAYLWAMTASIADAATRASQKRAQPGSDGSTTMTAVSSGIASTLPIVGADTVPAVGAVKNTILET